MEVIKKTDLKNCHYYRGKTRQRGMPIGLWSAEKQVFICIKPAEFGTFQLYEMNHTEDNDGYVCFEPVEDLGGL